MTAAVVCAPPAWRLTEIWRRDEIDPVQLAVEEILQLRHDIDDHDLAVRLLRGIRPDMTVEHLELAILDLLALGDEVRDVQDCGLRRAAEDAQDQYAAALARLAYGGAR